MSTAPYSVSVVLDRNYGHRLRDPLKTGPVWAVDSEVNRKYALDIWAEKPDISHLQGLTLFKVADDTSPEDMLIGEMWTIDLHHGVDSADPPFTIIRVFGCSMTSEVQEALKSFDFELFTETGTGFEATRPLPS
jgi:hypothetical protein